MQSMAMGMAATTRRKTSFPTGVTDSPQKGVADNSRHGFLCLYQTQIEATNYRLAKRMNPSQAAATLKELPRVRTINHKPHPNLPQGEGKKPKHRPHSSLFQEKERNHNLLKHNGNGFPSLGESWGGAHNAPPSPTPIKKNVAGNSILATLYEIGRYGRPILSGYFLFFL